MMIPGRIIVVLLFLPLLLWWASPPIAAAELASASQLEQYRQKILHQIEELKVLRARSLHSLERAQQAQELARALKDEAALSVAARAVAKATAALDGLRQALETEQGNLARLSRAIEQKTNLTFIRPKARLTIHTVPNPMLAPKGTWLRYVKSDRASLILDALEEGKGDLELAIAYLDGQIIQHDRSRAAESALSYLEGLRTSYLSAGEEYRKQTQGDGKTASVDSRAMLEAVVAAAGAPQWPGPENPNPGNKPLNRDDWRVKRADKMLAALEATPNDLEKTYQALQDDKDIFAAANAEHYLRGAFAYWDYLGITNEK